MESPSPFKPSRPPMLVSDVVKTGSRRGLKIFFALFGGICLLFAITAMSLYIWLDRVGVFEIDHEKIAELQTFNYQDNSLVYDRNGNKIGEFFDQYHVFVPHKNLPPHFIDALIAIEDKNFFDHNGIDVQAIVRAIVSRIKTGKFSQGASTITQQLVRNKFLSREKTLERKILEISLALKTEKILSKEKILELYSNTMFLGNGAYGLGAAAQRYFGKAVNELTPSESALIAGLYQSPTRYNPSKHPDRAKRRQLAVLKALEKSGKITVEEFNKLAAEPLIYKKYQFINSSSAPWFIDYVQDIVQNMPGELLKNAKRSGLRIHTSLDLNLQQMAENSVRVYEPQLNELTQRTSKLKDLKTGLERHATIEASLLATDPKTGEVLAMVGGRDYQKSKFNRAVSSLRSPGSVFKPIVYTEALARGYRWSDMIFVSPINIENYRPRNMKDDYLTETTMLRAFYRSMNSPTVEIAQQLGLKSIIDRARSLGIRSPIKNEFGSALGSSDLTMLDLARAYGTYPSGGLLTEITPIMKITSADGQIIWEAPNIIKRQKRVLNSQLAYLMTEGMRTVLSTGTGHKSAHLADVAAGKTGTSNDSADNWFCGFTPDMVTIVWVGTDEHAPIMANVTGGSIALPIWDEFTQGSKSIRSSRQFEQPEGIIAESIHPLYGHKVSNGTKMFFLSNRPPEQTESALENIENSGGKAYRNVFRH
ncbi:MAG: PBP1A family penicillin-binding protein [bacterium]